ncbi:MULTISPECIES: hypothetical protein [Rufibacter]|uniref:Co-chaperone DjlA N-terminal domain-containing protein n=1 Tax=Rufibacter quisquiliarum TaxID=1549639 RepID=A0A839GLI3_9BACT|nr:MULTISPECIES: hypothetical protein [Rufibacter]MBA9075328.1 hypothetical protein [Rufibacter quisquiliarum]
MATGKSFDDVFDTKEKKLAFFQNLVLVAIADRNIEEEESDFLVTIGQQLNLSEEDTRAIGDNVTNLTFTIPEEGLQKTLELQTLVQMMMQDGHMARREYNLCLHYANQIGYGKDVLQDMIDQFSNGQEA